MWSEGLNGLRLAAILAGLASAGMARAEPLSGAALVEALRQGGYVLLMRHASSPLAPPVASTAEPDNTRLERQLDDNIGRAASDFLVVMLHIEREANLYLLGEGADALHTAYGPFDRDLLGVGGDMPVLSAQREMALAPPSSAPS
jgi:hypothetical protein